MIIYLDQGKHQYDRHRDEQFHQFFVKYRTRLTPCTIFEEDATI